MAKPTDELPLLRRYQDGDHQGVWDELIALGPAAREPGHLSDALAVARETMARVRDNLAEVAGRLGRLGFTCGADDGRSFFKAAGPDAPARVAAFERRWGTLPLSGRAWYEAVDHTCLYGSIRPEGAAPGVLWHLNWTSVQTLDASLAFGLEWWEESNGACAGPGERRRGLDPDAGHDPAAPPPKFPLVGFGSCASNCEEIGFRISSLEADSVVLDEGDGECHFVDFLRANLVGPEDGRWHGALTQEGMWL